MPLQPARMRRWMLSMLRRITLPVFARCLLLAPSSASGPGTNAKRRLVRLPCHPERRRCRRQRRSDHTQAYGRRTFDDTARMCWTT